MAKYSTFLTLLRVWFRLIKLKKLMASKDYHGLKQSWKRQKIWLSLWWNLLSPKQSHPSPTFDEFDIGLSLEIHYYIHHMLWWLFNQSILFIHFIVSLHWPFFFSPFSVIVVYVTVLAHSTCIELIMRTIPGLFCSSVFMITIVAHSLCIMCFIGMPTTIDLFSIISNTLHLFI